MSMLMMLPFVAQALGQIIYGVLFEQLEALPWIIVFASAAVSLAAALFSRRYFKRI
jgi:hypothetical protein